ncbi:MAG: MFS transporter, partial [Anaerolineae bacterium]|nr:MFS transporter [Anaerolineae bacterium]
EFGRAVGGWIAANVVGGLSGRLSSGIITDFFSWRVVFVCFGVLTLFAAVVMLVGLASESYPTRAGWR